MTILTATNERVQTFIKNHFQPPMTKAKKNRFNLFTQLVERGQQFIDELFPRKQQAVLDEIMYLTSGTGIAKIGAAHLAKRADVSERTVSNAVKNIKATDQYLVARLNNNGAGKYIFVDKLHPNFKAIMEFVFSQDATQFAYQFATQEIAENVDTEPPNEEKEDSNCNNPNNLKQEILDNNSACADNHFIQENEKTYPQPLDIEKHSFEKQYELLETYATNDTQKHIFEFLYPFVTTSFLRDELYKIALRIGRDTGFKAFHLAKDVILRINEKVKHGLVIRESIVALFECMYSEAKVNKAKVFYDDVQVLDDVGVSAATTAPVKKPVIFYNWLDERE